MNKIPKYKTKNNINKVYINVSKKNTFNKTKCDANQKLNLDIKTKILFNENDLNKTKKIINSFSVNDGKLFTHISTSRINKKGHNKKKLCVNKSSVLLTKKGGNLVNKKLSINSSFRYPKNIEDKIKKEISNINIFTSTHMNFM